MIVRIYFFCNPGNLEFSIFLLYLVKHWKYNTRLNLQVTICDIKFQYEKLTKGWVWRPIELITALDRLTQKDLNVKTNVDDTDIHLAHSAM